MTLYQLNTEHRADKNNLAYQISDCDYKDMRCQ